MADKVKIRAWALKDFLKFKGLTQKQVATDILHITPDHLNRLLRENEMDYSILDKICKVIDVWPEYFYDDQSFPGIYDYHRYWAHECHANDNKDTLDDIYRIMWKTGWGDWADRFTKSEKETVCHTVEIVIRALLEDLREKRENSYAPYDAFVEEYDDPELMDFLFQLDNKEGEILEKRWEEEQKQKTTPPSNNTSEEN